MKRDLQLSFLEGMDRPVGPIPQSVIAGDNGTLIRAVAPMYLCGSVLDVTYGKGMWWTRFRPDPFVFHDLALDGVDFRALPYGAGEFDTVAFDPPYVESGSRSTSGRHRFLDGYGLGTEREDRVDPAETQSLMAAGLAEACRVARWWVLVKCMEYVAWHKFHDAPTDLITEAAALGWRLHDRIVHASGGGIGGGYRIKTVLRAQRAHSYLLVFAPAKVRKR